MSRSRARRRQPQDQHPPMPTADNGERVEPSEDQELPDDQPTVDADEGDAVAESVELPDRDEFPSMRTVDASLSGVPLADRHAQHRFRGDLGTMTRKQLRGARLLQGGLEAQGVRLADGKPCDRPTSAIKWVLEQLADAYDAGD